MNAPVRRMKFVICIGWIIKGARKKNKVWHVACYRPKNAIDCFVYHTVEMINENWLAMKLFIFFSSFGAYLFTLKHPLQLQ